jgi:PAS domain-containing protein
LERYFWQQIQVFDSVTSVYFGNTEGGLVDAGREGAEGSLYVIVTDEFTSGPFRKYATDSAGNHTDLLVTIPDFDARTRSWYSDAVEKGDATWSDVYILFTGQDMAISASRPVYDEQQNLLGVVSNDIFVSHISDFLRNLQIGETGSSFIMERSGLLIASSTDEEPFTDLDGDQVQKRLYASESTIPIIRYAAESLTEQLGDYDNISDEQQFEFEIDGQRQFLQTVPIQDEYGIDWLVVVVIPESDFMARINANNRAAAFLIIVTLVIAVVVGVITTRKIIGPILQLGTFAHALSQGEWGQLTSHDSRISEISTLTGSFNHMAGQLQQMVAELTIEVTERKQAEEALQESDKRFKLSMDATNDGLWDWNIKTGGGYFSPGYYCMLGYEVGDFPMHGNAWNNLIHHRPTLRHSLWSLDRRSAAS